MKFLINIKKVIVIKDNMYKKNLGNYGEDIAIKYLEESGYKILDRNFITKKGEIDIIAYYRNEYIFIEVKTRSSNKYGRPIEAVNKIKEHNIIESSKYYIYKNKLENKYIRYDIIEVYFCGMKQPLINHIFNTFF